MKAMLLAAGRGKRMRELTAEQPKPLMVLHGKAVIVWQIEKLRDAGFRELVINCGYRGEQLPEALGDGQSFGVSIAYTREPETGLETGGGIINALPLLGPDPFVVANGDVWTDFPYRTLRRPLGGLAHLVLVPNPEHNPHGDFGLEGSQCRNAAPARWTFSGIGVYHPAMFAGIDGGVVPLAPILRDAISAGRVTGELHQGEWCDVGTPERYRALDAMLRARGS